MKQVLISKRKYSWKDVVKVVTIIAGHYFFFAFYVAVVLGIRYALYRDHFFLEIDYRTWLIYYPVSVAPIISSSLHVIYAEKGSPWFRFSMWLHGMFNAVLVPVIALV